MRNRYKRLEEEKNEERRKGEGIKEERNIEHK